jgi:hypothetical protein
METTPQSRPWFVLLPLAILALLLLMAPMRHLTANQMKLVALPPNGYAWALREQGVKATSLPDSDPGEEQKAVKALSANLPNDYQIQLAYSLMAEWSHALNTPDDRVKRLDAFAGEFPSRATVYAHMLRYETEREVKVRRQTEYEVTVKQTDKDEVRVDSDELRPPDDLKKHLEEYERYAVAGEKLDPQNAYFSLMRAVGEFAALRDEDAINSIIAASKKTHYEDYVNDEMEADWRLSSEAFGDNSAALKSIIQGGVGSPHLAQLQALGRTAAAVAIKLELDRQFDKAIKLRIATAHCGKLIRSQSHTMPSALVGCDMTHEQIFRPGGAPVMVEDVNLSTAEREQQRVDAYFKYLSQHGQASEVAWMRNELQQIALVKAIHQDAAGASLSPYGKNGMKVAAWWLYDYTILINIVVLTAVAVPAAIICIKKNFKTSTLTVTLIVAYALLLALAFQSQGGMALTAMRSQFIDWILHNKDNGTATTGVGVTDRLFDSSNIHGMVLLLSMLSTGIVMGLIYKRSRDTDIVFVDTLRIEFVKYTSLVLTVCIVIYGMCLLKTNKEESMLHQELHEVMQSEGKYIAPIVGKTWPD